MTRHFLDDRTAVYSWDCLDVLREIQNDCVDLVLTDPPYGLSDHRRTDIEACLRSWLAGEPYQPRAKHGFMDKGWDAWVPGPEIWRETLRVLKPGGHMMAFAGTRSMDLMSMSIRLAGFELRDSIGFAHDGGGAPILAWVHAQGMPKSRNLNGGVGTALKPAWEPIILARKPLLGTVANTYEAYGIGVLHIDSCRVGEGTGEVRRVKYPDIRGGNLGQDKRAYADRAPIIREVIDQGRWPANVMHDGSDAVLARFPRSGGQLAKARNGDSTDETKSAKASFRNTNGVGRHSDEGSASRFYFAAKPSSAERGVSDHPTVKPLSLMRYLARLGCPPDGVVLDPFAGSGTTVEAALLEGFHAIGIERDDEYYDSILRRVARARRG